MPKADNYAVVQGDGSYYLKDGDKRKEGSKVPGYISWDEHLEAWSEYNRRYPGQDAESIDDRGGFGYFELVDYLGHPPRTWRPR